MSIQRIIKQRLVKVGLYFLVGLVLIWALAACGSSHPIATLNPAAQPLAAVAALPDPQLPDWIEQISPTGEVAPLAQIRIRFKEPLIPLERLDSPQHQDTLKKFQLKPDLPGQFRFLTPRMVGFQAEQALPKATRVQVTLKAGLADLKNHRLEQDLAWTFNTEPIKLSDLPNLPTEKGAWIEPVDLQPNLEITANTELDTGSVQARLIPEGQAGEVPLKIELKPADLHAPEPEFDDRSPQEKFDPALQTWRYVLTSQRSLNKATRYKLELSAGIRPQRGNLASEEPFVGAIMTYAPLAFEKLDWSDPPHAGGAYGRFVQGAAILKFNNGLVAQTALDQIQVNPPPKPAAPQLLRAYDEDPVVSLNPWSLEPATRYTITIGADLKDKFGQTLGQPVTVQYDTGDVAADLWAPTGLNIFPAASNLQLNLSVVNLPKPEYKAAYRVVQPTDLVYTDSAYPRGEGTNLLPEATTWKSFPVKDAQKNQVAEIAVPLQERLGQKTGMLAYGVQARTYRYTEDKATKWREPLFYGLVQLTNLGVFSQWFPESGLIRVNHLDDGSAVPGAKVEIYRSQLEAESRPTPQTCATGTTDRTGILVLDRKALQGCFPAGQPSFTDPPQLLTIVREDQDWTFARSLEWSGSYGYGLYGGWNSNKPESRGTIFSDRKLYQPGETAWLTAAAYYLQNGQLQQDQQVSYQITLKDPKGAKTDLGRQTTNAFGTFSLELPLKTNQTLGNYTIEAKSDRGVEIRGDFRVAEFKPPNFQVDLSLSQEFARRGDRITAEAQSRYLFGAPLQSGQVAYYITRTKADFIPKGWEEFSFGRQWFWPEEEPSLPSDVLQTQATLDEAGKGSQKVSVGDDLPHAMTYRVDAEVKDVSNLSVANSKTFTALPSDRLIGLKTNFIADAGQPFKVQVIVTDPQGQPIKGEAVKLDLQQMIYSNVTQVIEGSRVPRDQVEYKSVAQAETRSAEQPQWVELTAPESGSYRIRANLANSRDEVTATDSRIWVAGAGPVSWGSRYRNYRLELQLDKKTYRPGEMANVIIQSPYPEGQLYLAVVRHKTLYQTVTPVKGGAPQVRFQVTPDMIPNAAVEAVLIRQGQPMQTLQPGELQSVASLARIGFAPFQTNLEGQYLQVEVTPQAASLQPGQEQTVQLQLKNPQGQPTEGQLTVMAVNEAVLQLTNYRPPDLVKTVYAEQAISTRFADNRPEVVLAPLSSPIAKGWGFGGGLSAGAGDTRIRKAFKPLAYYQGSVLTDANGKASVNFKLPDDLTTWRVMAVATDGQLRFGKGEATFVSSQPLVTNPVLPQFARVGDRLQGGLAVTNSTGQSGTLNITATLGGAVELADQGANRREAEAPKATQAYRFPIVASRPGEGMVQFVTQLNQISDGFEVPLPVQPLETTEQVVETGTTDTQVQIPLQVDPQVVNEAGGLDVTLASTLMPQLKAPARQVLNEEQLPLLEPAASQLAIAATLQQLGQTYGQTFGEFQPSQQATQALERLQKLQRPDGGFAYFPAQDRADPFVSPYVAEALALAAAAKLPQDSGMADRLKTYLQKTLANPAQYDFCQEQRCKDQLRLEALLGLAALGDRKSDFLAELYERRQQFDTVDQLRLVRYLSQWPQWQTEATALSQQLEQIMYQTGRSTTVNLPRRWWWFNSPTTAQAEALRLFIARKATPEQLDKLVTALLDLRRDGTWRCAYDNAQALIALAEYSQLLPTPPNFSASAKLQDKTLLSGQFQGYQKPSLETSVPTAQLPRGQSQLQLQKSGQGTLHYLAAYRYRLQGNPPGRFNGLRVTRSIHPANQKDTLTTMGLATITQPFKVKPGQVFDIELEVITDHPIDHLVINDPLPAGFEAVDTTFQTATPYFQAQSDSWQVGCQTIYRDRVMAYGDHLDAGVYSLHYLVRSVTPGSFHYPGSEVHLQYAPEEFGRSASAMVEVVD